MLIGADITQIPRVCRVASCWVLKIAKGVAILPKNKRIFGAREIFKIPSNLNRLSFFIRFPLPELKCSLFKIR